MKIAQVLVSDAWGGVDSGSLERGIGGREGALIRLAREWARLGHEVTCFVPTRQPERVYEGDGFFEFVPYTMARQCLATFPYWAAVAWECPSAFADERIVQRNPVRLVEMQCAHLSNYETDSAGEFATGVIGLSQWHVDFMAHSGIEGPFHVLPNGVDLEHYPWRERKGLPRKQKFFYSSSPDRGLWHLLKLWPHIKAQWPEAELNVAYGVKKWLAQAIWSHRREGAMAVEIYGLLNQPGVVDAGQMPHSDLAKLQCASNVMAYPCDTIQPTETGCITAIEAMAAGCPVVTTDCDCMAEEFGEVAGIVELPFRPAEYLDALKELLGTKSIYTDLVVRGRAFAETRQWKDIARSWIDLFESQQS